MSRAPLLPEPAEPLRLLADTTEIRRFAFDGVMVPSLLLTPPYSHAYVEKYLYTPRRIRAAVYRFANIYSSSAAATYHTIAIYAVIAEADIKTI